MADEGESHVLLVAFAAQGHINPMLKFGRRLASKGLRVTLATTDNARERFSKAVASTGGDRHEIRLEFFSDGMSLDFDRITHMDHFFQQLGEHGPGNLTKLIDDVYHSRGRKLCCIVNNPFVPWVANVADKLGLPCAMLFIQPCMLYATYYRYYTGLNEFPPLDDPEVEVHLPGLPVLKKDDLPSFLLPSNPLPTIPKVLSQCFLNMEKVKWVLGNSFYELEKKVVESMASIRPIIPVGPLVPPALLGEEDTSSDQSVMDLWKPEEHCLQWLDQKPPASVVYISFGSVVVLRPEEMENIARGLRNSSFPFLWVIKPGENSTDDKDGGISPPDFLKETEEQGLVVTWCPQTRVLSHPSVACFVTHCGWNSTLETVTSGVPAVAYPQWTDQPMNAKLLEDVLEMGVRMKAGSDGVVSQEEVERCIAEVMTGPKSAKMKAAASKWKEAARAAVAHGGSSDQSIQTFVEQIISMDSSSSDL
ncbi:UDP-glycosyltransferase 84B2-like [Aristolochia californica]|uniref:UDP-glycosyltransferase 84B2-like n=1 Tax=Aristolochia californica TaxID=171875 RepID=UPI0035D645C8